MQPVKILITVLLIIFTGQAVFAGPWGTGGGTGATVSTDLTDAANISRLDAANVFTAKNTFTNIAIPTSSGVVSCPTTTDNLDGTITLGADGVVVFQDTLDGTGAFVKLTCSTGATITPVDQTLTFVYANYNAGSPVYATTTNAMDFLADFRKIPVFRVFAEGTHFHINNYDEPGILGSSKALFKDVTLNGFQRASGLVLSTSGTRISTISAGTTWFGIKFQALTENVAGTTGELYEYYRTAGVWSSSLVTEYDSIYYSDGTDRQILGTAKYVAKYFYMGVEDDNHAYYIHGNTHNSAALALAEPAPVTPAVISSHSLYVGKIIVLQGATTGTAYPRVWDQALQVSGVTDHDDLTGIDSAGTGVLYGHVNADAQDIYGVKTFNSFPVSPSSAPTTDYQFSNKKYIDDAIVDTVDGPASAVDNNIPVFDGITGKLVKDSGATIDINGISLTPAAGGGGITFTDSSSPGTDKDMAEITGGYGFGADGAENAFLILWAKIAGTMTNIFNYTPATDTIDFHKPTTFQAGDIVNAEIADGTIEADKLEATNSLVDNYIPSYDSASGGFTWVAGGAISITEQSNDPTYNELSTGDMVVATTSGDMFYKSATGLYTIPGVYALDPTTPTLVSATVSDNIDGINSDLTLVFSESITVGTGGNGGVTLNTPTSAGTYVSGDVSTTLVYSLATPILSTDTPTITYTQPGDGLASTAAAIEVATITEGAVTNNSTLSGATYADVLFYWGAENTSTADKPIGLTATTSTLLYQTTPKLAGTHSAVFNSDIYDRCQWPNTADAVFDRTAGRVGGWISTGASFADDNVYFEANYDTDNYVRFRNFGTGGGIEVLWRGGGVNHQAYVTGGLLASTAYHIEFSHSATAIKMYIDGVEQTLTTSGTFTAMTSTTANGTISVGASVVIGSAPAGASYDQWMISNDVNRDLHAIRLETNLE